MCIYDHHTLPWSVHHHTSDTEMDSPVDSEEESDLEKRIYLARELVWSSHIDWGKKTPEHEFAEKKQYVRNTFKLLKLLEEHVSELRPMIEQLEETDAKRMNLGIKLASCLCGLSDGYSHMYTISEKHNYLVVKFPKDLPSETKAQRFERIREIRKFCEENKFEDD